MAQHKLELDKNRRSLVVDGRSVDLTKNEWTLMSDVLRYLGRVVTYESCYRLLWDDEEPEDADRALRIHLVRLRKKLRPLGLANLVSTRREVGLYADRALVRGIVVTVDAVQ